MYKILMTKKETIHGHHRLLNSLPCVYYEDFEILDKNASIMFTKYKALEK